MRPAAILALLATTTSAACERADELQVEPLAAPPLPVVAVAKPPPLPVTVPKPPNPVAPEVVIGHPGMGRVAEPPPAHTAIPVPPSDEPRVYAAWLHGLPAADRARVQRFCAGLPRTYDLRCGGIGALHIPYPPGGRVRAPRPTDPASYFASWDAWRAALSPAQTAYVDRQCPPDEDRPSSDLCGDNTPLVVAFDGEPVAFAAGGAFAFAPRGARTATDWPTAATPWLALDRDGDGAISSGAELFGDHTAGGAYRNGFAALAALDANGDGVIDARDPAFAQLVLWADTNGDQRSTPDELTPLAARVTALSLAAHLDARCDARANCEGERAALTWRDASGATRTGALVDVYLPSR